MLKLLSYQQGLENVYCFRCTSFLKDFKLGEIELWLAFFKSEDGMKFRRSFDHAERVESSVETCVVAKEGKPDINLGSDVGPGFTRRKLRHISHLHSPTTLVDHCLPSDSKDKNVMSLHPQHKSQAI